MRVDLAIRTSPDATDRRAFLQLLLAATAMPRHAAASQAGTPPAREAGPDAPGHHVRPGDSIQEALEKAARDPVNKTVFVHAGTYRPQAKGQALIWFNARHDGITLQAVGDVDADRGQSARSPTAAPPAIRPSSITSSISATASRQRRSCAASRSPARTTSRPAPASSRRSSPTTCARRCSSIPTAAASRSTRGRIRRSSRSRSTATTRARAAAASRSSISTRCRSRRSSATASSATTAPRRPGSAVDLLHGSRAMLENCLFVGNIANMGVDVRRPARPAANTIRENGSGALTVFERIACDGQPLHVHRQLERRRRRRHRQHLRRLIFWKNNLPGGISPGKRYEIDIVDGGGVKRCFINGDVNDLRETIDRKGANTFDAPDPRFDAHVRPVSAPHYAERRLSAGESRLPATVSLRAVYGSRTSIVELILIGAWTVCFLPDGHVHFDAVDASPRRRGRNRADRRCARDSRSCRR